MKSVLVCLIFFLVLFTTTGDCVVINRTETEEPHTVRSCTAPLQCVEKYCNDACVYRIHYFQICTKSKAMPGYSGRLRDTERKRPPTLTLNREEHISLPHVLPRSLHHHWLDRAAVVWGLPAPCGDAPFGGSFGRRSLKSETSLPNEKRAPFTPMGMRL
ncbi:hypothetical protein CRG98_027769 [Punica granatum]|uniref:Uncharacterized protein n=1 Tax=Punica granatum TaxID=22663 RepID=A0A2I0J6I5_PUNGR|nr:hypothetical protein CRG98_027769 [Punica granatum]